MEQRTTVECHLLKQKVETIADELKNQCSEAIAELSELSEKQKLGIAKLEAYNIAVAIRQTLDWMLDTRTPEPYLDELIRGINKRQTP